MESGFGMDFYEMDVVRVIVIVTQNLPPRLIKKEKIPRNIGWYLNSTKRENCKKIVFGAAADRTPDFIEFIWFPIQNWSHANEALYH